MSFKKISSLENCRFRFKKIQTQQEQKPFFQISLNHIINLLLWRRNIHAVVKIWQVGEPLKFCVGATGENDSPWENMLSIVV